MMPYKVADNIYFGREVPLYNNGQMHRDWTYIDDIVKGVLAAVDRPLGYEVITLGHGEPVLLADFVRLIEELAGRKAHLVPAPMPDVDIPYTYGTSARLAACWITTQSSRCRKGWPGFWSGMRRQSWEETNQGQKHEPPHPTGPQTRL
jgi:UDP-glucuronate 4-epimerase